VNPNNTHRYAKTIETTEKAARVIAKGAAVGLPTYAAWALIPGVGGFVAATIAACTMLAFVTEKTKKKQD
jgi:hypothetical protein